MTHKLIAFQVLSSLMIDLKYLECEGGIKMLQKNLNLKFSQKLH